MASDDDASISSLAQQMNDKKDEIEDDQEKKQAEEKPAQEKKADTDVQKKDDDKSATEDKKDDKKAEQPPSEVKSQVQADIKAEDLKAGPKKEGAPAPELPFKGYIAIKDKLKETPVEQFSYEIIQRTDGLNHLLLSDVNALMQSIAHDFPDIAKTYSIGKSFEGRDINVIELTKGGAPEASSDSDEKAEKKRKAKEGFI